MPLQPSDGIKAARDATTHEILQGRNVIVVAHYLQQQGRSRRHQEPIQGDSCISLIFSTGIIIIRIRYLPSYDRYLAHSSRE